MIENVFFNVSYLNINRYYFCYFHSSYINIFFEGIRGKSDTVIEWLNTVKYELTGIAEQWVHFPNSSLLMRHLEQISVKL